VTGDLELGLQDPLRSLTRSCEVNCVVACCGANAFDVDSQHIVEWIYKNRLSKAWEALDQLAGVAHIVSLHEQRVTSHVDEFNAIWTVPECLDYLRVWQQQILRAIETVSRHAVLIDLVGLTPTVIALARGICDEFAFDRLPILADALQEAGCNNADMLAHCRGPGPHARGCWVVDLVLAKS